MIALAVVSPTAANRSKSERTNVVEDAMELLEEKPNAIRAGEHNPIVAAQFESTSCSVCLSISFETVISGSSIDLRAERRQFRRELG